MWARRTVAVCLGALIAAVVALPGDAATAQPAPVSACTSPFDLSNGSFETPDVGGFEIVDQSHVTGWRTTEPDGGIEIWQSGYLGVPAAAGEQFAELSANQRGELFQDRATAPGSRLSYAVAHRGRSGTDTMQIRIGPPGGPPNLTRIVSTGNESWRSVFGAYTIPPGQTTTRFGFAAFKNASGDLTIGNFLDDIILTAAQCTLTVRKALAPASDSGRFDLLAAGQVLARAVGDGGTAGPLALPLADLTISERATPATDATRYASAMRCTDAASGELLAQSDGTQTTLHLDRARDVSCVATNVRGPAVVLRSALVPVGDPGRFDLFVNGRRVASGAGAGTVAGPTRVPPGAVSVAEASSAGTNGSDYASAIECRDRAGRGELVARARVRRVAFDVAPNGVVACMLLNVAQASPAPLPAPASPVAPTPPSPARSVDLTVRASAAPDRVRAGERARFRVRVGNRGPLTATDVRFVPFVAQGGQRVRRPGLVVAGERGVCAAGRRAGACVLPRLAPGEALTLSITARTSSRVLAPVRLIAGAAAAEPDRRPADNRDGARVLVRAPRARPCRGRALC